MRLFPPEMKYTSSDKGHGRLETRTIEISTSRARTHIPFISQCFRITRETTFLNGNRKRLEIAYGITSLTPNKADAKKLLTLNRGHWTIENSEHYVRDVTFDEDRSRIRKGSGPRVMATLRNLVISLLRMLGFDNIAKGIRYFAWGHSNEAIRVLGIKT